MINMLPSASQNVWIITKDVSWALHEEQKSAKPLRALRCKCKGISGNSIPPSVGQEWCSSSSHLWLSWLLQGSLMGSGFGCPSMTPQMRTQRPSLRLSPQCHKCSSKVEETTKRWPLSHWGMRWRSWANSLTLNSAHLLLQSWEFLGKPSPPRWVFLHRLQGFRHVAVTSCSSPPSQTPSSLQPPSLDLYQLNQPCFIVQNTPGYTSAKYPFMSCSCTLASQGNNQGFKVSFTPFSPLSSPSERKKTGKSLLPTEIIYAGPLGRSSCLARNSWSLKYP